MAKRRLGFRLGAWIFAVVWVGWHGWAFAEPEDAIAAVRAVLDRQVGDWNKGDLNGFLEKAIDKYRAIGRYFNRARHVTSQIRLGIHELHCAAAKNKAWPNEHGITDFLRYRHGLFSAYRRSVGSLP